MSFDSVAIPTIVCAIIAAVLFLMVARRVMKLFVRLAIAGVIVVVILLGGALMWWRGGGTGTGTLQQRDNRTPAARRSTTAH